MSDIYELAVRKKLRFTTSKGQLSAEELWDLNLTSLDTLAKAVNRELKSADEESFIPTASKRPSSILNLKLDILKHVISEKVKEDEAAKTRAANRDLRARLKELAANKADEALSGKSLEELQKMIAELPEE
jgi:hypothetical protein